MATNPGSSFLTNLDVQYFGQTGSCVVNLAAAAVRLTECSSFTLHLEQQQQYRVETFPDSICVTPTVPWSQPRPPYLGDGPRRPPVPPPRPTPPSVGGNGGNGGSGGNVIGSGRGGNGGAGGSGGNVVTPPSRPGVVNNGRPRDDGGRGSGSRPPIGGQGGSGGSGGNVRGSGTGGNGGAGGNGGVVIGSGQGGNGGAGGNGGVVIGSGRGGNGGPGGHGGHVGRAIGGAGGNGGDGGNAVGSGVGGEGGEGGSGGSASGSGVGGNGGNGGKGGDAFGWFPNGPVVTVSTSTTTRPPVGPPTPYGGYPVRPRPGYPVGPKYPTGPKGPSDPTYPTNPQYPTDPQYPTRPQRPDHCHDEPVSVDPLTLDIAEADIKIHLELLGLDVDVSVSISDLLGREHGDDYRRALTHRYTPRCGRRSLHGYPGAETVPTVRSSVECVSVCTARAYSAAAAAGVLRDCLAASYAAADQLCYVVVGGRDAGPFDYAALPEHDDDDGEADEDTYTLDY